MKQLLVKVVIIFCFLICLPNSFSADRYVDISLSDDTGDGTVWGTAKKYLQSALTAASSGDNIYVAQGTYYPDEGTGQTDNARTSAFQLVDGVKIYGGYPTGGGTRNISTNKTTLNGDLDQSGTKNNNDAYHVVKGADNATIDGFTITGGYANGSTNETKNGGGLYNYSSNPTVNNCKFTENTVTQYGGAVHNESNSATTITGCAFSDNTAGLGGGAINGYATSPVISNCSFSSNQATSGPGGAVRHYNNGNPTFSNCTFSGNTSGLQGGAVYRGAGTGTLSMTTCVFSNNTSSSNGGGISSDGNHSFKQCTFSNNDGINGGALSITSGAPTITNCVISGNGASTNGGGIYSSGASPAVTNCTFYNNTAASGDGCYDASSSAAIKNSILWGSSSQVAGTPAITYSDVQQSSGIYSGSGNINSNPLFVSGSDFHLTDYSPCLGAGTISGAPSNDRDYNSRPNPGGTNPDMGAYESALETALPVETVAFCAAVQGQYVILEWITETELDNMGFIIERSVSGGAYETIASYLTDDALKGQGTCSNRTEYKYTDTEVLPSETYTYRLSNKDLNGNINENNRIIITLAERPEVTELLPVYPNPFNPTARIQYNLAEDTDVTLSVVDILGRTVMTITANERQTAGSYSVRWNGDNNSGLRAASGVYHLILQAGDVIKTQKVVFLR